MQKIVIGRGTCMIFVWTVSYNRYNLARPIMNYVIIYLEKVYLYKKS